ncbi:MAG: hypothetical protein O3C57_05620 [Verrucomicrobia bacterium]|nr:hypothetical protein [Verrucomicrobiota bacterium]
MPRRTQTAIVQPVESLANMSAPPRTGFRTEMIPVGERILVFDLIPLTARKVKPETSIFTLKGMPSESEVEAITKQLPGFLIGMPAPEDTQTGMETVTNTALLIALLSHRVGRLFVHARQANYTFGYLQEPFFVMDWGWKGAL